jgi:hypothetical protein
MKIVLNNKTNCGFSVLASLMVIMTCASSVHAALTPTLFYSAGTSGGTPTEGNGSWANSVTATYAAWRTSISSTAATAPLFGTSSSGVVVQVGGLNSGTANTVQIGSSGSGALPNVGSIVLAKPNAGGYTFTASNVAKGGSTPAGINIYGVNDGVNNTGIYMNSDTPTTTFGATVTNALMASLWYKNLNSAANLIINGPIVGAFGLTTAGNITLGGANTFSGPLTVSSGTATIAGATAINATTIPTVSSGATLAMTNVSVTSPVTNNGTLSIGGSAQTAVSSLTSTAALGSGAINMAGASGFLSYLTNTYSSTQSIGNLTLGGYSLLSLNNTLTTAALTLSGSGNVINYTQVGVISTAGTNNIVNSTAAISGTPSSANISMIVQGGSGPVTLTYGAAPVSTGGRTSGQLTSSANALQYVVTGGAFNLLWGGGSTGTWDYTTANWYTNNAGSPTGSLQVAYSGDNITVGTAATIAIGSGGVTAGYLVTTNTNAAGSVSFTGANTLNVAAGMTNAGSGGVTVSSPLNISSGGLILNGGGTTTLSGVATVIGGVTVTNGSTLNINNTGDSVTGGIKVTGQGTATIGAAGDLTGTVATVTLTNGSLNLGGFTDSPNAGGIALAGSGTISNGTLTLGTGKTVTNTTGVNEISASLDGTNGAVVTVAASSTLTLSGANTTFGGFVVNNGTVKAGNGSIGTAVITNNGGSTLDLNGQTVGNTLTNSVGTNYLINSSSSMGTFSGNATTSYFEISPGNNNITLTGTVKAANRFSVTNAPGGTGMAILNGPIIMASNKSLYASNNGIFQLGSLFTFANTGNIKATDGEFDMNGQSLTTGYNTASMGNLTTTTTNLYNSAASTVSTFGTTAAVLSIGGTATGRTTVVGAASGATLNIASKIQDANSPLDSTLIVSGRGTVTLTAPTGSSYGTNQVNRYATETIGGTANLGASALNILGTLTSTNSFTLTGPTTITINDASGSTPGDSFGVINVGASGTLTYAGTLNLNVPSTGLNPFTDTLFSFTTVTGDFTAANIIEASQTFSMSTVASSGIWTAVDNNGATFSFNDATGVLTVVPEPGTCAMVGLGLSALAVTIIRRRRND